MRRPGRARPVRVVGPLQRIQLLVKAIADLVGGREHPVREVIRPVEEARVRRGEVAVRRQTVQLPHDARLHLVVGMVVRGAVVDRVLGGKRDAPDLKAARLGIQVERVVRADIDEGCVSGDAFVLKDPSVIPQTRKFSEDGRFGS